MVRNPWAKTIMGKSTHRARDKRTDAAGLEAGDVLVSVNDQLISSFREAELAVRVDVADIAAADVEGAEHAATDGATSGGDTGVESGKQGATASPASVEAVVLRGGETHKMGFALLRASHRIIPHVVPITSNE